MKTLRRADQRDWTDWASGYQWNVTGTLNFVQNRKPSVQEAIKQWRSFLNIADRLAYGKAYKQCRIPRFACLHLGANRDNPHLQFVMQWRGHPAPFCIALNAIWAGFSQAAPPANNSITPTICEFRSIHYGGHEHWFQGADTYLLDLMHQPEPGEVALTDAINRLNAYAKPIWLNRAQAAFPLHVAKAQQDFDNKRASKV